MHKDNAKTTLDEIINLINVMIKHFCLVILLSNNEVKYYLEVLLNNTFRVIINF